MKTHVRDLRINPFRDPDRYPINRGKVDALKTSFELTGVWPNLFGRPSPTEQGAIDLGYGVHRLTALLELHEEYPDDPKYSEIDIPVTDISDADMLRIMAHENMAEWAHSAEIDQETVRSTVLAYAAGKIALSLVHRKARRVRNAPSFCADDNLSDARASDKLSYTAETVARFLKWKRQKVSVALDALAAIEEDLADRDTFKELGPKQADVVTQETRRVHLETGDKELAHDVGNQLAEGMRQSTVTTRNAAQKADEFSAEGRYEPPERALPPLDKFVRDLIGVISSFLPEPVSDEASLSKRDRQGQDRQAKLQQVIDYRAHLSDEDAANLRGALENLIERLIGFADQLRVPPPKSNGKALPDRTHM